MVTISNGKEKLYAVMRHTYTHADMLKDKTNARDKKCSQFPEGFFQPLLYLLWHVAPGLKARTVPHTHAMFAVMLLKKVKKFSFNLYVYISFFYLSL